MTSQTEFETILDRRIREVSAKADEAKRKGDDATMYRLNTAFHWLDAVRRDVAALVDGEQR